jgi:acyl-CoA hydrolase
MTTPAQQKIRDKTITAKQWAEMVKSGDWINIGGPGSDPTATLDALGERLGEGPGQVKNIEIWAQANTLAPPILQKWDGEMKYHVFHEDFMLVSGRHWNDKCNGCVDWCHWGWSLGMNYKYARWARNKKSEHAIDWGIQSIAKPEHGLINLSYGVNNAMVTARTCKKFVAEIRQDYAWCEGGQNITLPIDDVDYFIEVDTDKYKWPYINEKAFVPSETDKAIANNVLKIMGDGDCLQVGIGNLPTAVCHAIREAGLKHLGVHSEMAGEWIFTLTEAGCIDNSMKNIDRGRCVWAYILPADPKRYYEWLHHNSFFAGYDIFYPNNILTLSENDHQIGINNFMAMDLYGQDCASHYAGRPISGTGGHFQFTVGCALAKGGRGVLVASSRNREGKSRFVPTLPGGCIVDVPAQFVSWVATENGIVNLSGKTEYERAHDIIHILAHPDDREWLEKEAYKLNLIPKHFKLSPDRRYPDYWKDLRDYKHPYTSLFHGYDYIGDKLTGR